MKIFLIQKIMNNNNGHKSFSLLQKKKKIYKPIQRGYTLFRIFDENIFLIMSAINNLCKLLKMILKLKKKFFF